jgi:hypothetical protein
MVIEIPSDIANQIGSDEQALRLQLAIFFYKEFQTPSGNCFFLKSSFLRKY